jgi:NAD(P)-dependent dehydrogenase (short-subunit alcohol dehydrogenase family)
MADWRNAMDVNLFGTMHMTQAVLPQMKKQKSGSIVMINTMATRTPNQLESGYAVSKGALKTAVQYLAQDLGPFGIRVNSTFMGWMWGAPVIGYFESEAKRLGVPIESLVDQVAQQIPLRKIPQDSDCAMAALYLASDFAKVITGAQLDVNGGHYLPC